MERSGYKNNLRIKLLLIRNSVTNNILRIIIGVSEMFLAPHAGGRRVGVKINVFIDLKREFLIKN